MKTNNDELKRVLTDLFVTCNSIAVCPTVPTTIRTSLSIVRDRVRAQCASLFLFSKDGYLQRQAICGVDASGNELTDSWFSNECYAPGVSFTGKVLCRGEGSRFGEPYWSARLDEDTSLDTVSRSEYLQKLGLLQCAVVVPLNGIHRTFGAVEVINKIGGNVNSSQQEVFDWNDIHWLSITSIAISASISHLRRREELTLLMETANQIARTLTDQDEASTIYERIANALVGPLTPYKACVIRLPQTPDVLNVIAKAGDRIVWEGRLDEPVSSNGARIVSLVYVTGKRVIVKRIADREEDFYNLTWIRNNGLKSFGCFPLAVKGEILGTISLYIGYEYDFDPEEIGFLDSIASLVGSLTDGLHIAGKLRLANRDLQEDREKNVSSARVAGSIAQVAEERHKHKEVLFKVGLGLTEIASLVSGKAGRLLQRQIALLDRELNEAKQDLTGENYFSRLNLNHLIKSLLRYFALEFRADRVRFEPIYGDVPDIVANEAQVRDIIVNLVSNAAKAIKKAGERGGVIAVRTELVTVDQREFIQISVKDDGVGIRNEDRERIYVRGFTTYPGGTGMGLFIAKQIVESYHGSISYESSVGKGTAFVVRLPLKPIAWQEEM
jgi:anti-sigma regulatory factor (Ser/Thr protein kinase)